MTARFRRLLGSAVQGPIPTTVDHMFVTVEDAVAQQAVRVGSAEPLVLAVPQLTASVEQLVVVCSVRGSTAPALEASTRRRPTVPEAARPTQP